MLFAFLSIFLVVDVAHAKVARAPYNMKMYVQSYLRSVRKLSATDASFIVEGQISYAYRADELWYSFSDGDSYNVAPEGYVSEVSYISDKTPNGINQKIDFAEGYTYFKFSPIFPSQITNYYLSSSWIINYGVPSFTGLPDTSVAPEMAGSLTEEWLAS